MIANITNIELLGKKPRTNGITIGIDSGISIAQLHNKVPNIAKSLDFICLEPQNLYADTSIAEKVSAYKQLGIEPFINGLVFESAFIRNQIQEYTDFLLKNGITTIEVASGVVQISTEKYGELIASLSKNFTVIARIGARKNDFEFASDAWKKYSEQAFNNGAKYILIEGTESGTSLLYNGVQEVKDSLVYTISQIANNDQIIWEAPTEGQQVWYTQKYGAQVNLSRIPLESVLLLQSIRAGLHLHTFTQNLPLQSTQEHIRKFDTLYNLDWQI